MKSALREKWTKLYEVSTNVVRHKPWSWIDEEKLIIVKAYEGLDFYLSVMGSHGMFEGIMLCTSKRALCNYSEMQANAIPDLYGINYQQGILMVFNEEKYSLPKNVEIANEFMPRKINNKIITFESFVKGYMPSPIIEEELDDAILVYTALDKMLIAFEKSKKCATLEQEKINLMKDLFVNDENKCLQIDYNEDEDTLNFDVTDIPEIGDLAYSLVANEDIAELSKDFKRHKTVYEIELLNYLPIPIEHVSYKNPMMNESIDKDLLLRYFIVANHRTGKIYKFLPHENAIMSNSEEKAYIEKCMNLLLEIFSNDGIPQKLLVRDEETNIIISDLVEQLKIKSEVSPLLDVVDDFLYGFFEHITGESLDLLENMSEEDAINYINDFEEEPDDEELEDFFNIIKGYKKDNEDDDEDDDDDDDEDDE